MSGAHYSADPIAEQLELATARWRDHHDERELRRALLKLLAEIG